MGEGDGGAGAPSDLGAHQGAPVWERVMSDDGVKGTMGRLVRGTGVVALASRRRPGRFAVLDDVRRYWDALRGERLLPLRSEIDPRGIEGALSTRPSWWSAIAPGIARFRLAGSHLVDLMGSEVRGMPLSVLFAGESRADLAEAVEGVFRGPEMLRLILSGERGLARPTLDAQLLLLPLRSDLGDVTRALGCLVCHGGFGRAPRRLVIRSAERVDILDARLGRAPAAEPTRQPARALAPPPSAPLSSTPVPAASVAAPAASRLARRARRPSPEGRRRRRLSRRTAGRPDGPPVRAR